jgi:hypothetical protein
VHYARYARADVDDFMTKVLPGAPTTETKGLFQFRSAAKRAHAVQGTVLRLLYEGSVKRVGLDPDMPRGIYALLLDPEELKKLIASRVAPELADSEILSVEQTAKILGVSKRCVEQLSRHGYLVEVRLSETTPKARNFARGIRQGDLDEFRMRYVAGRDVANMFGLARPELSFILKKRAPHVTVAFPSEIGTVFYDRKEIEDPKLQQYLRERGMLAKRARRAAA